MTRAFTPCATRWSRHSRAYSRTSPIGLSPYGCRAVSPRYSSDSCGSWSITDLATVQPPNPESKIPMGASRDDEGTNAQGRWSHPRPHSDATEVTPTADYSKSLACGGPRDGSTPSKRLLTDSPACTRAIASAKRAATVRTLSSGQSLGAGTVSVVTTSVIIGC